MRHQGAADGIKAEELTRGAAKRSLWRSTGASPSTNPRSAKTDDGLFGAAACKKLHACSRFPRNPAQRIWPVRSADWADRQAEDRSAQELTVRAKSEPRKTRCQAKATAAPLKYEAV